MCSLNVCGFFVYKGIMGMEHFLALKSGQAGMSAWTHLLETVGPQTTC